MAEVKSVDPRFQLRAVELHELTINKPARGAPPLVNFNFEINIEMNLDGKQKLIITGTKVKITADDKKTEMGSIVCACVFSVANFEEVVTMRDPTKGEIHDDFAETLASISISTTRGVMFSELKGTVLHHAFLPIIDIKSLSKAPVPQT